MWCVPSLTVYPSELFCSHVSSLNHRIVDSGRVISAINMNSKGERVLPTQSEVQSDTGEKQENANPIVENPWPYLQKYFVFGENSKAADQATKDNQLSFRCQLCCPKQVVVKTHASSCSNLKSHVKRIHPSIVDRFENDIQKGISANKKNGMSGRHPVWMLWDQHLLRRKKHGSFR